eukprot:TRINITY_DN3225_c0_g1_i2.p1 TRINITY_DN3225_c0_g1~~TRINITY_DN3225_c0_g1_i2.p1  ORF type:complete len:755 (+),score=86.77 TRINITY_DN3225_c0_g1_i2:501-2765(+)
MPTDLKVLRSFLGLASYFRTYIKDFARITAPMYELLKAEVKWEWTDECDRAFAEIKDVLISPECMLYLPDFDELFYVDSDWSPVGIGAVLYQIQEDTRRPVCYFSRKLHGAELNYSAYAGECLALLEAVRKFRVYIWGAKFVVRTDHDTLKWMKSMSLKNTKYGRWILELQEYDFDIEHIKGTNNQIADFLSRGFKVSQDGPDVHMIQRVLSRNVLFVDLLSRKDIAAAQRRDEEMSEIIKLLENGNILDDQFDKYNAYFLESDGLLCESWLKPGKTAQIFHRIVLPTKFRLDVFRYFHDDAVTGGHLGKEKTMSKIRKRFTWTGMFKDVDYWIDTCVDCLKRNSKRKNKHRLIPIKSTERFEILAIDVLSGLGTTTNGNNCIIVITEYVSKMVFAFAAPNHRAETIAAFIVKRIVCVFGAPRMLISDQGKEFCGTVANCMYDILNIRKIRTSAYHPQSDGLVERFNATIVNMLSKYVNGYLDDWDLYLDFVVASYNWADHSATGESPFFLTFGREPLTSLDAMLKRGKKTKVNPVEKAKKDIHKFLETGLSAAIEKNDLYKRKRFQKFEDEDVPYDFNPGDLVMLRAYLSGTAKKLKKKWTGPYRIIEVLEKNARLETIEGEETSFPPVVSLDRLKKCQIRINDSTEIYEEDVSIDEIHDEDISKVWTQDEVESGDIVLSRVGRRFRAKWKLAFGGYRWFEGKIIGYDPVSKEYTFLYDTSERLKGTWEMAVKNFKIELLPEEVISEGEDVTV